MSAIPAGYKQTEVGVIPEDWEPARLGNLGRWFSGGTPSLSNSSYWSGDIPWASPKDMKLPRLWDAIDHISVKAVADGARILPIGAVLMVVRGMILAHSFPVARVERPLAINQDMKALVTQDGVDSNFVLFWLTANAQRLRSLTTESTHGTKRLPSETLFCEIICLPSLSEQRAIAAALSDVDALLAKLDQFIAKKRDLKQAAMQQLLTGQTRIPGFDAAWEVKRLGDVFSISAGKSKSSFIEAGGRYWVVDMGSVSTDGKLVVTKATNYYGDFLNIGDLVMPKDDIGGGGIIGRVGYINAEKTYVLGDHVYRLKANQGNSLFLSYVINGHRINSELRKKVIGTAQLGLGRKSVDDQEVPFPPRDEQTAIATVLSDMDAEIAKLEARRDKTRALKQGMMQELLTGRIRLV